MTELIRSACSIRRSNLPGPRKCAWPMNSSSERGRILAASGFADSRNSRSWSSKSPFKKINLHRMPVELICVNPQYKGGTDDRVV